ncbi:MAG: group II intron reverse transcriptase/maturase [Chitinivibrionales bacterium]|nr:group II intron reverse transcriptase/maturase [Chitinivibrionales bacterium]MBD3395029.1 group II intron reverse transcriptase/maturase [Chitinivibrionales bacterium]
MSAQKKAMNVRNKVQALQDKLSCAAKQSLDRRFGALYDKLYREDVLQVAWARVRANKGAPGIDKQSIAWVEREIGVAEFLREIQRELHDYTYRAQPVRRYWIDKPGKSEKRPLGIPVVKDRVVQMAAKLILEPIFERNFVNGSHGFRPGLSQHTAIDMIRRGITFERLTMVIDADIKGCFTNIRHDIVVRLLRRRISDERVIRLIKGWLRAGVMDAGVYVDSDDVGTPQGGVISPLLCNVYLHTFDKMFAASGIYGKMVRYADDFVVLMRGDARRALRLIRQMLRRLGLEVHPEKTKLVSARKGFDFLSAHFRLRDVRKRGSKLRASCRLWPSDAALVRIKQKIRERIGRRFSLSLEEMIGELNPLIRGWNNYQQYRTGCNVERKRFDYLNHFVWDRLRIFLKRKYSDRSRAGWRLLDNRPVKLGLCQFG